MSTMIMCELKCPKCGAPLLMCIDTWHAHCSYVGADGLPACDYGCKPQDVQPLEVLRLVFSSPESRLRTTALEEFNKVSGKFIDGPKLELGAILRLFRHWTEPDTTVSPTALALMCEVLRLRAIINNPQIDNFILAVSNESSHQYQMWDGNDQNKQVGDWIMLFTRLMGKIVEGAWKGNWEKVLHHIVALAASCQRAHAVLHARHFPNKTS